MVRAVNGRHCRAYLAGPRDEPLFVTYHRRRNGRTRLLTVSPKLMRKVLREGAA